eukprot:CAMPEP_0180155092 /NCGR_PEP_ID=MMETSP0986-20121125/24590_1 /TAXON_ID=697907 /ORGANISM="non described non described, Strain CCMP2293" /LENGTH=42 /DNA_ID= /DNA_START= /DNA_END= /DNA_ORIENTATION=
MPTCREEKLAFLSAMEEQVPSKTLQACREEKLAFLSAMEEQV